jgi:hypothetical protein
MVKTHKTEPIMEEEGEAKEGGGAEELEERIKRKR